MSSPDPLPKEIQLAAERGELQKVVKWLRKGGQTDSFCSATATNFSATNFRTISLTLLHAAAGYGHLELVRELLKRGASVDLPSSIGSTALMDATAGGSLSIVLLLLQHSADPDLQDIDGWTALMSAAHKGYEACVKALLRAEANTDLQNIDGVTALMKAAYGGHEACVQALLRAKACLLYTSPSPRDKRQSRMPSSA